MNNYSSGPGGRSARGTVNVTNGGFGVGAITWGHTALTEIEMEPREEKEQTPSLSRNLASRWKWFRMYGPIICGTSSTVQSSPVMSALSNVAGSISRRSNTKRR